MPGELAHAVNYDGKSLDSVEIQSICESLGTTTTRFLSLRDCNISDQGFKRLLKSIARSKSLLQLTLNVGILTNKYRVDGLAGALQRNRSIRSLFVHGNPLKDEGLKTIGRAVVKHPQICSVDFGDCMLGDDSIDTISELLASHGTKPGLTELCLSANPGITVKGWAKLSMVIAKSRWLKSLFVDFNKLGDAAAGFLLVALATSNSLEELDMEGTNVTDFTVELVLHWIQTHEAKLKMVRLDKNKVDPSLLQSLYSALNIVDDSIVMSEESSICTEMSQDEMEKVETKEMAANQTTVEAVIHPVKHSVSCWENPDEDKNSLLDDTSVHNGENKAINEKPEIESVVSDDKRCQTISSRSDEESHGTPREAKKMSEDFLVDEGIGTFPQEDVDNTAELQPLETFYQEESFETFYGDGNAEQDKQANRSQIIENEKLEKERTYLKTETDENKKEDKRLETSKTFVKSEYEPKEIISEHAEVDMNQKKDASNVGNKEKYDRDVTLKVDDQGKNRKMDLLNLGEKGKHGKEEITTEVYGNQKESKEMEKSNIGRKAQIDGNQKENKQPETSKNRDGRGKNTEDIKTNVDETKESYKQADTTKRNEEDKHGEENKSKPKVQKVKKVRKIRGTD
ncbi:hypothetical protein ScPMuIL_014975 [Solemya velum]